MKNEFTDNRFLSKPMCGSVIDKAFNYENSVEGYFVKTV